MDAQPQAQSSTNTTSSQLSGYRIVNMSLLGEMFKQLLCPNCRTPSIDLQVKPARGSIIGIAGLHSVLMAHCETCKQTVASTATSEKTVPDLGATANIRAVASARNCGMGYQQLTQFTAGLDIPQVMHQRTYQRIASGLRESAVACQEECYSKAVSSVRKYYCAMDKSLDPNGNIPIIVSYDGTWHRRGHSSHHGVGVVIELHTGLVIDTYVVSNYCAKCSVSMPATSDPTYSDWCKEHKQECSMNYKGSSVSMEVEAAKVIFGRSVSKYKLIYQTCLYDGDAKTIMALNKIPVYPQPVIKEDCVNHIAKRMKNGIMTLRKSLMGTKDSISGSKKGQVTEKVATKLTSYYATALQRNAPHLMAMKNAVFASINHMSSTDEQPNHLLCPAGEHSWCIHQREEFLKTPVRTKHHGELSLKCAKLLQPLYVRLTDPALLRRCSRMRTQNANECFNGQIWRRCPKTISTSKGTVEIAVAMASLDFNMGPTGFDKVLEKMKVTSGVHFQAHAIQGTKRRLSDASRHASEELKNQRKRRKIAKAGLAKPA